MNFQSALVCTALLLFLCTTLASGEEEVPFVELKLDTSTTLQLLSQEFTFQWSYAPKPSPSAEPTSSDFLLNGTAEGTLGRNVHFDTIVTGSFRLAVSGEEAEDDKALLPSTVSIQVEQRGVAGDTVAISVFGEGAEEKKSRRHKRGEEEEEEEEEDEKPSLVLVAAFDAGFGGKRAKGRYSSRRLGPGSFVLSFRTASSLFVQLIGDDGSILTGTGKGSYQAPPPTFWQKWGIPIAVSLVVFAVQTYNAIIEKQQRNKEIIKKEIVKAQLKKK